jgi:hypothetical protein
MTGAQASYLKTLCEQAGTPEIFEDNLTHQGSGIKADRRNA